MKDHRFERASFGRARTRMEDLSPDAFDTTPDDKTTYATPISILYPPTGEGKGDGVQTRAMKRNSQDSAPDGIREEEESTYLSPQ